MREYVLRRLVSMVPVLFLVSLISFALLYVLPGDPALAILGETGDQAYVSEPPIPRKAGAAYVLFTPGVPGAIDTAMMPVTAASSSIRPRRSAPGPPTRPRAASW